MSSFLKLLSLICKSLLNSIFSLSLELPLWILGIGLNKKMSPDCLLWQREYEIKASDAMLEKDYGYSFYF